MTRSIAISWNSEKLADFKATAELTSDDTVTWVDGKKEHKFDRNYAMYLIQYLEEAFSCPQIPLQPNNEGEEGQ